MYVFLCWFRFVYIKNHFKQKKVSSLAVSVSIVYMLLHSILLVCISWSQRSDLIYLGNILEYKRRIDLIKWIKKYWFVNWGIIDKHDKINWNCIRISSDACLWADRQTSRQVDRQLSISFFFKADLLHPFLSYFLCIHISSSFCVCTSPIYFIKVHVFI